MTTRKSLLQLATALVLFAPIASAQIITTVAGTDWHFPDGSLMAVNAPLGEVLSVAVDNAGNVFVADTQDCLVLRILVDGTTTIVAGNGICGFSGDEGLATAASLSEPRAVAVDSAGNLYIADNANERIRKVLPNGMITTIAGNGASGFSGDGGPATSASLALNFNGELLDSGVTVDSAGNLYIADTGNNRIRKVSNGTITTVAGNGTSGFTGDGGPASSASLYAPTGVAVDSNGSLYIADLGNERIRRVSSGTITTVAGGGNGFVLGDGGPATSASFDSPEGVVVDLAGNLYIADQFNNRIRKVSNGTITTVAGNGNAGFSGDGGSATGALLFQPFGVAVDSNGNLYIADTLNDRVRKVSGTTITTFAGNGDYRFSGDGGPATSATFDYPGAVAVDSAGNFYVADLDNNRIRKVSNGTITTVAGNGIPGFSGDGGPATSASLNQPAGVAVDAVGNLYIADTANFRIREVSNGTITTVAGGGSLSGGIGDGGSATGAFLDFPRGVAVDSAANVYIAEQSRIRKVSGGMITTVAGNGIEGFSGDGGPATNASLDEPTAVAVDPAGNLYIADTFNFRIREVSNGTITTVAGGGNPSEGIGDGGPATSAALLPTGVVENAAGTLYIADATNYRIRKVSDGTITTVAGGGDGIGLGDGGLATSASLGLNGVAMDAAGNLYIADIFNGRIREVLASPPTVGALVSGDSLSLTQASGGKPVTANLNVDTAITAANSVSVPGMNYFASFSTDGSWLSVLPQSGSTPGLVTVTGNPLNLSPGVYIGTIVISVPFANPPTQTVNVTFTVTAAIPPTLQLDQSHMSFTYATTSTARSQTLIVSNTGGGSLNFTTSIVYNSGGTANWLSVAPQSRTVTPVNPVSLAVKADPTMLGPGTYTASLTVSGGNAEPVTIPITMTITTNPFVMLLSQAGLTFTTIQNGGAVPAQTFGVLNLGSGTLNWTVQTSTLPPGLTWLNAMPLSGASTSGDVNGAPLVSVSVDPAGLAPGIYYGLVKVISPGAANTPQEVVAVLQVLAAGSDLAPIVQPTSLLFSSPAGVSSPSSQTVSVYDPTGTGKSFRSGVVSSASIETLPTDATIAATSPTDIVVQPLVNGLAPGTYPGTITLQFSDGRVSSVGVTFVLTGAGATTSENTHALPRDSSCTPTKLIPVLTSLGQGFTVPAGFPEGLTAQIADDCGNPLTQGQVSVEFSNGQALKNMQSLANGRWDVTWDTGSQQTSSVTLTVTAAHPTLPISGTAQIIGALGAPQAKPQVNDGGVVSAASFMATPIAPGGIVSVFGSLLSDATGSAAVLPLTTSLNNTTVKIGDQQLPLFYTSTGQLNAQVPFETPANTNIQLLVQRDNTYATPVYVDVAAAQPAIFQYPLNGQPEAIAVNSSGLIAPSNPAHAGDTLVLYCTGLGAVNQQVADGAASPEANAVNAATISVGGQSVTPVYAGLTPTLVGLYQINFTVPPNTGTGDQIPLVISSAGQNSAAAFISVR